MKQELKKAHIKSLLLGIIIGVIATSSCAFAAILYQASEVGYDNATSNLSSTNVQDALDELAVQAAAQARFNFQQYEEDDTVFGFMAGAKPIVCRIYNGITGCFAAGDTNATCKQAFGLSNNNCHSDETTSMLICSFTSNSAKCWGDGCGVCVASATTITCEEDPYC